MEKEKIEYFREILKDQLNQILKLAKESISHMRNKETVDIESIDQASSEEMRLFELRIRGRERNLISKINEALQRIDEGT